MAYATRIMRPTNDPKPPDRRAQAHAALDELLEMIVLQSATGSAYLRVDLNQGGITKLKIGFEKTAGERKVA